MNNKSSEESVKNAQSPEASLGEAVYPDKQVWKAEPGNRYTPEELREMDRNWDVQITNPYLPRVCQAD